MAQTLACCSQRLIIEARSQRSLFNLSTIAVEGHTVPFGGGFQMALRQRAGTKGKLHPQTLSSTLTPPPIPLFLRHFPFHSHHLHPVVYFYPLPLRYAVYPTPPCCLSKQDLSHVGPTVGHGRSSAVPPTPIPTPFAPLLTPPTGGDRALPFDYTRGAGVTMQP